MRTHFFVRLETRKPQAELWNSGFMRHTRFIKL